ncbi:CMP-N-acetylneuraminate-poly-alpha-2,8-sialyltransferase-like [Glandiceps talaboti]
MVPKRQLLRCTKLIGKCLLWGVLVVNVVIFVKMFGGGKLASHADLHESHLSLGSRGLSKLFPTSKSSSTNETVVVTLVTIRVNNSVSGDEEIIEDTAASQEETVVDAKKDVEKNVSVVEEKVVDIVKEEIPVVEKQTNIKKKEEDNKKESVKEETVVEKKVIEKRDAVKKEPVMEKKVIEKKEDVKKLIIKGKSVVEKTEFEMGESKEVANITLTFIEDEVEDPERIISLNAPLEKLELKKQPIKQISNTTLQNNTVNVNCSQDNASLDICKDKKLLKNKKIDTLVNQTIPATASKEIQWYRQKWSFNASAAKELRDMLETEFHNKEIFITSKKTTKLNSTLIYEAEPAKRLLITSQVHNVLPDESPYANKMFKTCSIVGNGGIILGSKCGKYIDKSDFVIRMNLPSVYNYTEDVGTRTDLVTCNPTLARSKYGGLKIEEDKTRFKVDLKEFQNASLLMPAFSYKVCTEPSFRVYSTLRSTGRKVIFTHPDYMFLARKYWTERGVEAIRLSSGMLLFTAAVGMCEEVHLYGFWPFKEDMNGNRVYYHYFDEKAYMLNKKKIAMHWHEMPQEFQILSELHKKGAIRMQVTKCTED